MSSTSKKFEGFRLPVLQGLLPIKGSQVPVEIVAGLTLAALAIPEVMGYTKISGTPVITGLYTMIIPMLVFAFLGSSRHLVVSADSATAAILAAGLVGLANTGTDEYLALAGVLAIMAGFFVILARVVGLAFLADFLSSSVLVGFLTGVGIQVALGQISGMLGLKGGGHGTMQKIWTDIQQLDHINYEALGVALAVLVVIVGARKISERIPGALIAVAGAIAASWAFDFGDSMHVLGAVPSGLPHFTLPGVDWSLDLIQRLMPIAFAMFVVILAQGAATSRAFASKYNESFDQNVDLSAMGLANIGAGLSGTFVVAGSPTKTQMVDSAGGRTQLTHLTAVGVVVLVLLFFTAPLAYMPESVLAAVVFLIGVDLIKVEEMKGIFRQRQTEFWVAVITGLTVVFVGVEQGILLAIVLSLIEHTRRGYRPKNSVLERNDAGQWVPRPVSSKVEAIPGLIIYRFTHSMYYANARQLSEEIMTLMNTAKPPLRWFCIDISAVSYVDYSAAQTVKSLFTALEERGTRLVVAQALEDVDPDDRHGLQKLIGEDGFYSTLDEVVEACQQDTHS